MMGDIKVTAVDRKRGTVTLAWEEWECTFMGGITGRIQLVSKVQTNKDRLYEQGRIPREAFSGMCRTVAAILKNHPEKVRKELVSFLKL